MIKYTSIWLKKLGGAILQKHIQLEVAIELITVKIAKLMNEIEKDKNNAEYREELLALMKQRDKIYMADKGSIEKIIKENGGIV